MKKYLVIPCLLLTMLLCHCKKSKNDDNTSGLKKGLLANFRLNENFLDSTGKCKILSSVTGTEGAYDRKLNFYNAIYFDGGKFTFETKDWSIPQLSISVWIQCVDITLNQYIIMAYPLNFDIRQSGQHLGMGVKTKGSMTAVTYGKIANKTWVHFVGTFDGAKIRVYLNGKFVTTSAVEGNIESPEEVTVGSNSLNNLHWKGVVDDLRFYNRILTDEEIAILANQ